MSQTLRKLSGVAGIGLSRSAAWGAAVAALWLFAALVRPQDIGPGEGILVAIRAGALTGFASGALFGLVLSITESRKAVLDLAPIRAALQGMLAAAVWPLVTPAHDSMVLILCPLGAACAAAAVAIARKARLGGAAPGGPAGPIGRLLARRLEAACVSRG